MKLFSSVLAVLGAFVATVGTSACPLFIIDEPKMPKCLLEK